MDINCTSLKINYSNGNAHFTRNKNEFKFSLRMLFKKVTKLSIQIDGQSRIGSKH